MTIARQIARHVRWGYIMQVITVQAVTAGASNGRKDNGNT